MNGEDSPITREDVERQLNVLEQITNAIGGEDDILRAVLHNQALMLKQIDAFNQQGAGGRLAGEGDRDSRSEPSSGLSINQAGIAIEEIPKGGQGQVVFNQRGSDFVETVEASNKVEADDIVYVNNLPNEVVPANSVDEGQLFGISAGDVAREGRTINADETDSAVNVGPGDGITTVLEVEVDGRGFWWETGTTDRDETDYIYKVDGDELFDDRQRAPLGLFDNRFRFPQAIRVQDKIEVLVERDQGAPTDSFVSKFIYYDTG